MVLYYKGKTLSGGAGGETGNIEQSLYEYAVAGGYKGSAEDLQSGFADAPWFSQKGGEIKTEKEITLLTVQDVGINMEVGAQEPFKIPVSQILLTDTGEIQIKIIRNDGETKIHLSQEGIQFTVPVDGIFRVNDFNLPLDANNLGDLQVHLDSLTQDYDSIHDEINNINGSLSEKVDSAYVEEAIQAAISGAMKEAY